MKTYLCLAWMLLLACLLSSCQLTDGERLERLLQEWNGKEIVYSKNPLLTVYGEKKVDSTIPASGYKLVL